MMFLPSSSLLVAARPAARNAQVSIRNASSLTVLVKRVRARAGLWVEELRDHGDDKYRETYFKWTRWRRGPIEAVRKLDPNVAAQRAHTLYLDSIIKFDDWFNLHFYRILGLVKKYMQNRQKCLGEEGISALFSQPKRSQPFDALAVGLIIAGSAGCAQGYPLLFLVGVWGFVRGIRRFAVLCVDDNDMPRLFRLVPGIPLHRRMEIFHRLHREVETYRALRRGDVQHADLSSIDFGHRDVKNPELNYTPEALFDDAMASITKHHRVLDVLGSNVQPTTEPDKVVYRIREGIAEVCLGWEVCGAISCAEVQVKSTASNVDFIYIFPRGSQRGGFVIRPHGNWSLDRSELPRNHKRPFDGAATGWDWSMREFRHENHPRSGRRW